MLPPDHYPFWWGYGSNSPRLTEYQALIKGTAELVSDIGPASNAYFGAELKEYWKPTIPNFNRRFRGRYLVLPYPRNVLAMRPRNRLAIRPREIGVGPIADRGVVGVQFGTEVGVQFGPEIGFRVGRSLCYIFSAVGEMSIPDNPVTPRGKSPIYVLYGGNIRNSRWKTLRIELHILRMRPVCVTNVRKTELYTRMDTDIAPSIQLYIRHILA